RLAEREHGRRPGRHGSERRFLFERRPEGEEEGGIARESRQAIAGPLLRRVEAEVPLAPMRHGEKEAPGKIARPVACGEDRGDLTGTTGMVAGTEPGLDRKST